MPTNEKKGIIVKIDAELHAEVRQYVEDHEMTMAEFVRRALQDESENVIIYGNVKLNRNKQVD